MNRTRISTLSLALLGTLALAACDNNVETAETTTDVPDTTAATDTLGADRDRIGVDDPLTNDRVDDTTTMGDASDPYGDPMTRDPALVPEDDALGNDELDQERLDPEYPDPTEGTPPAQ